MDIKAKLALLKKEASKAEKKHVVKKTQKPQRELVLPNFCIQEKNGRTVYWRDSIFPLDYKHGEIFLYEVLKIPKEIYSFLAQEKAFEDLDIFRTIFLDTETTGLAGGTGTIAFLIGAGFFHDNSFVVRQYFMPDYAYETAMLEALKEQMDNCQAVVTYNGKCFDLPLIMTRFHMNRLRVKGDEPLHLDLLHGSRRLWKKTYGSCALSSLENTVLSFYREDDVPGFLIPELYFKYLKNKNFKLLEKVFEHNLYDIISMAALTVKVWSQMEMAETGRIQPSEYFSLGRIFENNGDFEKALSYYSRAFEGNENPSLKRELLKKLACLNKKNKDFQQANYYWEQLTLISKLDPQPHIELSKYYEHCAGDLQKAYYHSGKAREVLLNRRSSGMGFKVEEIEEIDHRRRRIEKKMNGQQRTGAV